MPDEFETVEDRALDEVEAVGLGSLVGGILAAGLFGSHGGDELFACLLGFLAGGLLTFVVIRAILVALGFRRHRSGKPAWWVTWLGWLIGLLVFTEPPDHIALSLLVAFGAAGLTGAYLMGRVRRPSWWRRRRAAKVLPADDPLVIADDLTMLLEAAEEDCRALQRVDPRELSRDPNVDPVALRRSAEAALTEMRRLAKRVTQLRRVAEARPGDERAHGRAELAYQRFSRYSEAIEEAVEAARSYLSGHAVQTGLAGHARTLERLLSAEDELEQDLGALA